MAKCCECGVFNPTRAEMLLERIRKGNKESTGVDASVLSGK
jgi:hypothetical protein